MDTAWRANACRKRAGDRYAGIAQTAMAATGIRCDHSLPGMSGSLQREDAFLVEWHFYTRMRALRMRQGYNPNNHQSFR